MDPLGSLPNLAVVGCTTAALQWRCSYIAAASSRAKQQLMHEDLCYYNIQARFGWGLAVACFLRIKLRHLRYSVKSPLPGPGTLSATHDLHGQATSMKALLLSSRKPLLICPVLTTSHARLEWEDRRRPLQHLASSAVSRKLGDDNPQILSPQRLHVLIW